MNNEKDILLEMRVGGKTAVIGYLKRSPEGLISSSYG